MVTINDRELARIFVKGVVQGIGFRPFVYKLANKYGLKGLVYNTSEGVTIETEGNRTDINQFYTELLTDPPPLARIENSSISLLPIKGYTKFEIQPSVPEPGKYQLISPDIATCDNCVTELTDPCDRRYRYPFINCTNCGPRFTIIEDIPYDRPFTTMKSFKMCEDCRKEYEDPCNRRFHAEPIACPRCGPQLELLDACGNRIIATDVIKSSASLLKEGKILAIKGLGGFQLACDATNESSVNLLRLRKKRVSRPFALMVNNIDEAKQYCDISSLEEKLLKSSQSPIVLVRRKPCTLVCGSVAPGIVYLGLLLPYTPLHYLLLRDVKLPLVMTSGNISEEPISRDNSEALVHLKGIADYFLIHNRDIYARYDDSVTMIERKEVQVIRRARGYAPFPVRLNFQSKQILACGADEKNSFCLTRDNYAFVSQHIGDLDNLETLDSLETTIALYRKLFRIEPEIIACDLHPDYASTRYATALASQKDGLQLVPVQHHHSHIVSCMVDNAIDTPVIGVAFDGTGFGSDGHLWGGEFLLADYKGFQRLGHLEYLPLPGGELAIKKPYRTALAYNLKLLGKSSLNNMLPLLEDIPESEINMIEHQIRTGLNTPETSSIGRLFDAVSAFCGIRKLIDYDGQAAIELEMAAYEASESTTESYPFTIKEEGGTYIIHILELISSLISDISKGRSKSFIAAKFHLGIAGMIYEMCEHIGKKTGVKQVALSGGVFQNRLLLRLVIPILEKAHFIVFTHKQVPCNDGGIPLGQAVIANFHVNK
jgi:hydrogenase maturation protein HypF